MEGGRTKSFRADALPASSSRLRLAESLPEGDPRTGAAVAAARAHAEAALPHVVGADYMVEHWLAAYAVLMLS